MMFYKNIFQRCWRFIVFGVFALFFAIFPGYIFARNGLVYCPGGGPCTLCNLLQTGQNILNFMISPPGGIVFILATLGIMIGGIMIMVAGGNQSLYAKGVFALKAAIIGLFIVLIAWIFVNTIIVWLTGSQTPGGAPWPWYRIKC